MGQKPSAKERPPELKLALRWLRHRLRITQGEVAAAVRRQGGTLSLRHYQELEGGQKFPSPELRLQVLRALGSDDDELRGLLETQPWVERPAGRYHPSRVLPRPDPEDYLASARRALEWVAPEQTWSTPVARSPALERQSTDEATHDAAVATAGRVRAILSELEVLVPLL